MKPVRLTLAGLNSFVESQTIDFEALSSRGLFGIFGPTGSGKSTIVDGMIISLYGAGSIPRGTKDFINMDADQALLTFVFRTSFEGVMREIEIYRVYKRSGEGYRSHQNRLILRTMEGEILWIEDKLSEVNRRIEEIMGLKADEFLKMVVLPQGQFSAFLQMDPSSRRSMLQSLFGLELYGDQLNEKLKRKMGVLNSEISTISGRLAVFEGVSKEIAALQKNNVDELNLKTLRLDTEFKQYKLAYEVFQFRFDREKRFMTLCSEQQLHLEQSTLIGQHQLRVSRHKRALPAGLIDIELQKHIQIWKKSVENSDLCRRNYSELAIDHKTHLTQFETLKYEHNRLPVLKLEADNLRQKLESAKRVELKITELVKTDAALMAIETQKSMIQDTLNQISLSQSEVAERIVQLEKLQKQFRLTSETMIDISEAESQWRQMLVYSVRLKEIKSNIELCGKSVFEFEISETKHKALSSALELEQVQCINEISHYENEMDTTRMAVEDQRKISTELKNQYSLLIKIYQSWEEDTKARLKLKEEIDLMTDSLHDRSMDYTAGLAAKLRSRINKGDLCPVCGNICEDDSCLVLEKGVNAEWLERLEKDEQTLAVLKHREEILYESIERHHFALAEAGVLTEIEFEEFRKKTDLECAGVEALQIEVEALDVCLKKARHHREELIRRKKEVDQALETLRSGLASKASERSGLEARRDEMLEAFQKCTQIFDQYIRSLNDESLDPEKDQEEIEAHFKNKRTQIKNNEARERELKDMRLQNERFAKEKHQAFETLSEVNLSAERLLGQQRQLKAEIEQLSALVGSEGSVTSLQKQIETCTAHIEWVEREFPIELSRINAIEEALEKVHREMDLSIATVEANRRLMETTNEALKLKWIEAGFENEDEWKSALMTVEEAASLEETIKSHLEIARSLEEKIAEYSDLKLDSLLSVEDIRLSAEKMQNAETAWTMSIEARGKAVEALRKIETDLIQKLDTENELKVIERDLSYFNTLQRVLRGNRFVEFLAMNQLGYILQDASRRLMSMTANRYRLELDTRGNFRISDNHQGGVSRDLKTLSGGETFMTSLALALALSSRLQLRGNIRLETFLLDEGFGSLDAGLIDVVMQSLESLIGNQLSVGLISHVEALKARVPIRLEVAPAEPGISGTRVNMVVN